MPDPFGEVLAGGILQAGKIIQIVVVETLVERLEYRLDFGKVSDPAGMGINVALQIDRDLEGMAMQATAFVTFWNMGQPVSGFKLKIFK